MDKSGQVGHIGHNSQIGQITQEEWCESDISDIYDISDKKDTRWKFVRYARFVRKVTLCTQTGHNGQYGHIAHIRINRTEAGTCPFCTHSYRMHELPQMSLLPRKSDISGHITILWCDEDHRSTARFARFIPICPIYGDKGGFSGAKLWGQIGANRTYHDIWGVIGCKGTKRGGNGHIGQTG